VSSLAVNDRRQAESCNFSRNTIQSNKCSLLYVNKGQVPCRRTAVFVVCGTKKYRKGDGTGTVEKWYRGATVVPRNTSAQCNHAKNITLL